MRLLNDIQAEKKTVLIQDELQRFFFDDCVVTGLYVVEVGNFEVV